MNAVASAPNPNQPPLQTNAVEQRPNKKKTKLKPRSRSSAANLLGDDGFPIDTPAAGPAAPGPPSNGPALASLPPAPPAVGPNTMPATARGPGPQQQQNGGVMAPPVTAGGGVGDAGKNGKNGDGKKVEPQQRVVYDAATDKRMTELLALWTSFQANTRQHTAIVQSMDSRLLAVEKAVDRFGTFCGEYQLIWKVKNFAASYEDAVTGRRIAVLSPVFDTHRNGYKLQLSLCPNGDGKGKGQAMSVFFAILKGPYDSLLQWPYTCRVIMTLLEQVSDPSTNHPHDIVMTFTPNPRPDNQPFLGQPTSERNLSLGFPKFIGLKELFEGEYIKDDMMFIKVQVDLTDVIAL